MDLENYLNKINKFPRLDYENEVKTAKNIKKGDLKSRELLIKSNLKLVVYFAKKYARNGNLNDLIQEGNIGLIQAAEKFNPDLGYKFSTYAGWWIRKNIFSYFFEQQGIKLSHEQKDLKYKIYGIIDDYVIGFGKEPSTDIIAKKLNNIQEKIYSSNDISKLMQMYNSLAVKSYNEPIFFDSESEKLDFISDKEDNFSTLVFNQNLLNKVCEHIKNLDLNKKERSIYEMSIFNDKSFYEISSELGIGVESVKQNFYKIQKKVMQKLKNENLYYE